MRRPTTLIDLEPGSAERVHLEIRQINIVIDDEYSDHGNVPPSQVTIPSAAGGDRAV
jgi:hypothetical protein